MCFEFILDVKLNEKKYVLLNQAKLGPLGPRQEHIASRRIYGTNYNEFI